MIAVALGEIAALGSALVALAAIGVALRSNSHSRQAVLAAQKAADAAEAVARVEVRRHERELATEEAELKEREDAAKRAELVLWTQRVPDERRTFGTSGDGYLYFLSIFNTGASKARGWSISNLTCNDYPGAMPAFADADALSPPMALLPNRGLQIRLHSSGPRNSWDIAECDVSWEDDLGQHRRRFQVERRW